MSRGCIHRYDFRKHQFAAEDTSRHAHTVHDNVLHVAYHGSKDSEGHIFSSLTQLHASSTSSLPEAHAHAMLLQRVLHLESGEEQRGVRVAEASKLVHVQRVLLLEFIQLPGNAVRGGLE